MTVSGSNGAASRRKTLLRLVRTWGFLACMIGAYSILAGAAPDRAIASLKECGRVLLQVAVPMCVAFTVMVLLNIFVKPDHVSRLAGRGTGIKGWLLSTTAGIISMGPVYVWFPLLRSFREKGASDFHTANFLSNRAVKPFLIPLMVFYFGWTFSLVLTALMVFGALLTATVVGLIMRVGPSVSGRSDDTVAF